MTVADRPPVIVTDTTCDLPPAIFKQYNIHVLRHVITFGSESFRSGQDITLPQLYERLKAGEYAETAAPPVSDFTELYRSLGADGTPILSIHLSEALSKTIITAREAAAALPDLNITVWDSQTVSGALGLQVLTAARAAQEGKTVEAILPMLHQTRTNVQFLFCLDDLSYLVRGGRVGRVSYYVAQTLRLKPIITVSKDSDTLGTYVSTNERPRSLRAAIQSFARDIGRTVQRGASLRVVVLYGDDPSPKLAQELEAILRKEYACVFLERTTTTPVLAVHTGPRALGVGYIAGDWPGTLPDHILNE